MAAVRWDAASATIAARATPPGRGGLAVIRISGPGTRTILSALGAGRVLESPPRTAVLASIRSSDGALLDRGLVTFFPSPASFTGEDSGELSVHGGPVVVASVLEACFAAGARQAEAGEFTRRAWANGKLDRIQVEAIQDLVEAESPRFHRVAVQQVEGGLSRRLAAVRQGLVEVRVGLAHHLDFPDEDEAPTSAGALAGRLGELERSLQTLLSTAPGGRLLREGAVVVLAGRPNAGKSSLFNALLGEERVLVTPHAGTTRDAVDAMVSLNGFPFRVVDTAGLRESADEVESAGIEVAHRWIQGAQVLVWCHAAEMGPPTGEEVAALQALRSGTEAVLLPLATCMDRLAGVAGGAPGGFEAPEPRPEPEGWPEIGGRRWMPVSVVSGQGLEDVGKALVESVFGTPAKGTGGDGASAEEGHVLVRERQRTLVSAALGEIQVARARVAEGAPAELADLHLAEAEGALEALVGAVDSDEVMDALFREFCIGK